MQDYSVSKGGKGFKGKDGLQPEKMQVWRSSARCFQGGPDFPGCVFVRTSLCFWGDATCACVDMPMGFQGRVHVECGVNNVVVGVAFCDICA